MPRETDDDHTETDRTTEREIDAPRPGDVRSAVWADLMRERLAAYPLPPHGHNPNFRGAADAADALLAALFAEGALAAGAAALCAPDYVLRPLRKGLLERGCDVLVPPRYGDGWQRLLAGRVPSAGAATIQGAERHGERVPELPVGDLIWVFVACVAVDPAGAYLDKGYGFDVPTAAAGLPRATIVHPRMLRPAVTDPRGALTRWALPGGEVRSSEAVHSAAPDSRGRTTD